MPALKNYRLFISHTWAYNENYYRVINLLDSAPYFSWQNYSVPEHDPLDGGSNQRLTEELERQIRPVHAVLILAGMYVNSHGWVQREISLAQGYNKPMIGIVPWGHQRVPQVVQEVCCTLVGWNTHSIVSAIREYSL